MVQRLCGICPVSHHLAAAKAIDQIIGVDPEDLSLPAQKIRKLMHFGQVFQSHALHFFYLASPDLLFGVNSNPISRNVVGVAVENPELAKKGILLYEKRNLLLDYFRLNEWLLYHVLPLLLLDLLLFFSSS